jgi:AcrR family transcriptional regulator
VKQPRWQRRSEDRPREICAAALDVFAEKGFAAARLDEIAKRAGVSKGTLYLYFADKEELFRAVVRSAVSPNIEIIRNSLTSADVPFATLFPMLLERFAETTERVPIGAVAKMVIGESRNFPELARVWHDEVVNQGLETVAALVAAAQERGEIGAADPRTIAFSLLGPMLMGVLWREVLEPAGAAPLDIRAMARQHAEVVLHGLLTEQAK